MIYGYARVSTKGQAKDGNSLEAQEMALKDAGATVIYSDAFTGNKTHRPQLDELLSMLSSGDTIVVTKLDRVARSANQGMELIQSLLDKDTGMSHAEWVQMDAAKHHSQSLQYDADWVADIMDEEDY
ncbi:MAG: recombinase family protein [Lachnospiraceae bacterium]|nr:recombinase family protein [Lachnospiraceae bacterium]